MALDDAPLLELDRAGWRAWLEEQHGTATGAWLVINPPRGKRPDLDYEAAVEEALCFGWVDSTAGKTEDGRMKGYFAPRRPRSAWSASNKERVKRLRAAGRMAPAGQAAIDRAKANGWWSVLDGPERLEVPDDLRLALEARAGAAANFAGFTPSARKQMLAWVAMARRPETRAARIVKIAEAALRNERALG